MTHLRDNDRKKYEIQRYRQTSSVCIQIMSYILRSFFSAIARYFASWSGNGGRLINNVSVSSTNKFRIRKLNQIIIEFFEKCFHIWLAPARLNERLILNKFCLISSNFLLLFIRRFSFRKLLFFVCWKLWNVCVSSFFFTISIQSQW